MEARFGVPASRRQYNYDYAGQDPINSYDLSGMMDIAPPLIGLLINTGSAGFAPFRESYTFVAPTINVVVTSHVEVPTFAEGYGMPLPMPTLVTNSGSAEQAPSSDSSDEEITVQPRKSPGADGSESSIIKVRRGGETTAVIHQVVQPLADGKGGRIIHQHPKYGSDSRFREIG